MIKNRPHGQRPAESLTLRIKSAPKSKAVKSTKDLKREIVEKDELWLHYHGYSYIRVERVLDLLNSFEASVRGRIAEIDKNQLDVIADYWQRFELRRILDGGE